MEEYAHKFTADPEIKWEPEFMEISTERSLHKHLDLPNHTSYRI